MTVTERAERALRGFLIADIRGEGAHALAIEEVAMEITDAVREAIAALLLVDEYINGQDS